MLEKVLSALAAVLIPGLGLLLRASRRNRLRARISDYLALSDQLSEHDSSAAAEFKRLAGEAAQVLVVREQRWLRRNIDPAAVAALVFLVGPAVAVVVVAWDWDSGWKWPLVGTALVWAVLWTAAGLTQIWKERADDARQPSRTS